MNKIRLIFTAIIFVVLVAAVLVFNTVEVPFNGKLPSISEFKITEISANGNAYIASQPIPDRGTMTVDSAEIHQMQLKDEIYLRTGPRTAIEFYCSGISVSVLPDSYIYFHPKTNELRFYSGEFYWRKLDKNQQVEVSIRKDIKSTREVPPGVLTLSQFGKVEVSEDHLKIWNYSGLLKFNYGKTVHNLKANSSLVVRGTRIRTAVLLHAPESIAPSNKIIQLEKKGDSIVHFNWKTVKGAQRYVVRFYPSKLKESILFEKEVNTNKMILDLLTFKQVSDVYWQVFPYDFDNNTEGAPSQMGHLRVTGALLSTESSLKPPELIIHPLDVNGNLVLIKGKTDPNATLTINGDPITLTPEGGFVHTLSFPTIGKNQVIFRAVSPSGIEEVVEKIVTTYDD